MLLTAAILTGCGPKPDTALSKVSPSSRFSVERVGVIEDDLAYSDRRGIYILTDQKTGKQYIGLSGIGISELGSHTQSAGKTTTRVSDER